MTTGRVNISGGGARLNVFTQLSEPSVKEGIWLKTSRKYRKIISDSSAWLGGTFPDISLYADLPIARHKSRSIAYLGKVYVFGGLMGSSVNGAVYCYDIETNTWSLVSNMPTAVQGFSINLVGTKVYVIGGYATSNSTATGIVQIFDVEANTWSVGSSIDQVITGYRNIYNHSSVTEGEKIHTVGGNYYASGSNYILKVLTYDTELNAWSTEFEYSGSTYRTNNNEPSIILNKNIHLFKGTSHFKYDLVNKSVTTLPVMPFSASDSEVILLDDKVYICSETDMWSYSLINEVWANVGEVPVSAFGKRMAYYNGTIYFCGSGLIPSTASPVVFAYKFTSSDYENGTFVIIRIDNYNGEFKTELLTPINISGEFSRLLTAFNDAFLFVDDDLHSFESYYGDGEKWIKFKEAIA